MEGNGVALTNEEARETRRRSYYIIAAIVLVLWILSDSSIDNLWSNEPESEAETDHMQNFLNTTLVMQTTAIPFSQLKATLASVLWEAIDAFVNSTYAPNITTTYVGVSLLYFSSHHVSKRVHNASIHDTTYLVTRLHPILTLSSLSILVCETSDLDDIRPLRQTSQY